MPLFPRLYMKKSRQYNVVSKDLMVIRVELLDSTPVECTLSSESSGQECLDNVCQRFGIKQPKFFGLKYRARRSPPLRRWLDLDRPLKKQLDRFAESNYLHLGVMFYVSDIGTLQDEMTRTQYFLQLKTDVLECRLHCNYEQAVMLASYSLQAELGDYDADRHSAQYIREFSLFPKHMMLDEERRETLTEAALQSHSALRGLSQQLAEVYYIMEAQQLEGYGQEHFVCRDDCGNGVLVGASLTGIVVRLGGNRPPTFYRWADITNLHNHKRNFGIELTENRTAQFVMDDKELAKYVWKVCVQQHKFFETNQPLLSGKPAISQLPPPDIQSSAVPRAVEPGRSSPVDHAGQPAATFTQEPSYQADQGSYPAELTYQAEPPGSELRSYGLISGYSGQPHSESSWSLGQQQQQAAQARSLLPQYRQAPDYDTAVKQMYSGGGGGGGGGGAGPAEPPAAYIYRSQPEIHLLETDVTDFSQYKNYTDLSHLPSFGYHGNGAAATAIPAAGDLINSSVHTYSTPELASQSLADVTAEPVMTSELQLYQMYKPPPPYPYSKPASSSTPDLASANVQVSRSSPDLVSRKNRLNQPRLATGLSRQAHRTYENLTDSVAYSPQAAFSSEELDCVYPVGPASVSAQFVTQSAVVAEIARSQPADPAAAPAGGPAPPPPPPPAAGVDPQGPGSPSHFLSGNIRVSSVGPAPAADEPIYENVELIQRGRAYTGGSSPAGGGWTRDAAPPDIPVPAAAMQEIGISTATPAPAPAASNSSTLEKRRRKRWGGGESTPPEQSKSNTLRKIRETFTRSRDPPRIRTSDASGSGSGSGSGLIPGQSTPEAVVRRESTAIPREQRCQAIEARISDPGFFREFEAVAKKRETADCTTARRPENESHNRFKDVLPYEDNRVRVTPSRDNPFGYINASHISVTMGSQQRFYIAAQGPLPTTLLHFWQAVWENNVHLIVMLTDATRGHDRAYPYWPQQDNTSVECDDFTVRRNMSTPSRAYVTSRLVLTQRGSRKARVIWHLQYTDWADHGCPEDVAGFVQFVEELGSLRQTAASEMAVAPGGSRNTPVLVHCSAGVGRTGVTILCDVLLHCLDHNLEVDVPKLLHHLRQQRMLMVQTMTQYKFVYQVLAHYLKRSRLI